MNPAPSPGEHAVGTARMRLVRADIMALAQHITPVVAANLALRVIMVVLFAVFGLRHPS